MQLKNKIIRLVMPLLFILSGICASEKLSFQAEWDSLAQHLTTPEFLKDAKLEIYFYWGIYTLPARGSHLYPCCLHFNDLPLNPGGTALIAETHTAKFGAPNEYGY
ncbi:MAG: alpha-L-fucosidase, partial [Lentisphaeraceae bacterium]|nr:alpha-L-fucosidase [Lentisphaeraceae bacterium]